MAAALTGAERWFVGQRRQSIRCNGSYVKAFGRSCPVFRAVVAYALMQFRFQVPARDRADTLISNGMRGSTQPLVGPTSSGVNRTIQVYRHLCG